MTQEVKKEPRKQCSNCKDWKLVSEFFKEKKKPMGLQSRCKLCHKAGVKEWKKLHGRKEDACAAEQTSSSAPTE